MKSEYYTGILNGKEISFSRYYQSHRFTDEECQKLIHGDTIQIYGLESHGTTYGVEGQLRCKVFPGIAKPIESYAFARTKILSELEDDVLNNNKAHDDLDIVNDVILPKPIVNEKKSPFLDIFSDELDRKTIDVLDQNPMTLNKKKEPVDVLSGLSYLDQIILEERKKRENNEKHIDDAYETYELDNGFNRIESDMSESEIEHDASFDEGMDRYSDTEDDVMDYDFDDPVPSMFQESDKTSDDVIAE